MYTFLIEDIITFITNGDDYTLSSLRNNLNMVGYNEKGIISELLQGMLNSYQLSGNFDDMVKVRINHIIALSNPNVFC